MNRIPKIDCSWHGVQTGTETEFGVYQCPECHKRAQRGRARHQAKREIEKQLQEMSRGTVGT
jgi:hypothetical protein